MLNASAAMLEKGQSGTISLNVWQKEIYDINV